MSREYYTSRDDKVDFKMICLGHYKKILEISTIEFTGGYWNYNYSKDATTKQYVTDKRKEFIQAIELLSLALYPHFDKEMKDYYINFSKSFKDLKTKNTNDSEDKLLQSVELLELMKELFKEISCLMYRKNYFKGTSYQEGDFEEDVVDIDGYATD